MCEFPAGEVRASWWAGRRRWWEWGKCGFDSGRVGEDPEGDRSEEGVPGRAGAARAGVGEAWPPRRGSGATGAGGDAGAGGSGRGAGRVGAVGGGNRELVEDGGGLAQRPQIVAVNKVDLAEVRERLPELRELLERRGIDASFISAAEGEGTDELVRRMAEALAAAREGRAAG